jgi:hypothetical protein
MANGMKFDARSNFLFVAGGSSGRATVYDGITGAEIAFYQLSPSGAGSINDVIVTRDAAYFTDSAQPFLGRVALGPQTSVLRAVARFSRRSRTQPTGSRLQRTESISSSFT